ncbi:MAG: hypothetical protein KDC97_10770 [Confluentibacter sp.]|nr:hypothetical protein [Confluentibacter sp.]
MAPTLRPLPVPSMARTTSPTGAGTRNAKPETRGERRKKGYLIAVDSG